MSWTMSTLGTLCVPACPDRVQPPPTSIFFSLLACLAGAGKSSVQLDERKKVAHDTK